MKAVSGMQSRVGFGVASDHCAKGAPRNPLSTPSSHVHRKSNARLEASSSSASHFLQSTPTCVLQRTGLSHLQYIEMEAPSTSTSMKCLCKGCGEESSPSPSPHSFRAGQLRAGSMLSAGTHSSRVGNAPSPRLSERMGLCSSLHRLGTCQRDKAAATSHGVGAELAALGPLGGFSKDTSIGNQDRYSLGTDFGTSHQQDLRSKLAETVAALGAPFPRNPRGTRPRVTASYTLGPGYTQGTPPWASANTVDPGQLQPGVGGSPRDLSSLQPEFWQQQQRLHQFHVASLDRPAGPRLVQEEQGSEGGGGNPGANGERADIDVLAFSQLQSLDVAPAELMEDPGREDKVPEELPKAGKAQEEEPAAPAAQKATVNGVAHGSVSSVAGEDTGPSSLTMVGALQEEGRAPEVRFRAVLEDGAGGMQTSQTEEEEQPSDKVDLDLRGQRDLLEKTPERLQHETVDGLGQSDPVSHTSAEEDRSLEVEEAQEGEETEHKQPYVAHDEREEGSEGHEEVLAQQKQLLEELAQQQNLCQEPFPIGLVDSKDCGADTVIFEFGPALEDELSELEDRSGAVATTSRRGAGEVGTPGAGFVLVNGDSEARQEDSDTARNNSLERVASAEEGGLSDTTEIGVEGPQKELYLQVGVASLPHPYKASRGGEDAHLVEGNWLGVADGISAWAEQGINAGQYSRELLWNCVDVIRTSWELLGVCPKPQSVIEESHSRTDLRGSCTITLAVVEGKTLRVAHIGDSGFVLLPVGGSVMQSERMSHSLNDPYQIGHNFGDDPSCAMVYEAEVQHGDVILLASDGLFDNMYSEEIVRELRAGVEEGKDPEVVAKRLASLASKYGENKTGDTPFAERSRAEGQPHEGGKCEDVTVIVAYVNDPEEM